MLTNGKWAEAWRPHQGSDPGGVFVRQASSFRHWVTPDGSAGPSGDGGFPAEAGRYHLYVALTCPWASRTLMARKLKGLESVIGVTVVEPVLSDEGWRFGDYPGSDRDRLNGADYLHQIYAQADAGFTGRATVPILWDAASGTIVNNELSDIMRMLSGAFDAFATGDIDLYPEPLRPAIDELGERIYVPLNNGVYRAGLAQTQAAYDAAVSEVFATLDDIESGGIAAPSCSASRSPRRIFGSSSPSSASMSPTTGSSSATCADLPTIPTSRATPTPSWPFPPSRRRLISTTSSEAIIRSRRSTRA